VPRIVATAKKKPQVRASEVVIGSRTLEGVLLDLAEQVKANDVRSARAVERSARAEELATIALQTIAAVSQDLRALTQEIRTFNSRTEQRLDTLEKGTAAE
jgi:hypothetical protein